jgi:predicted lipoprotein with Yx(FWY)xxD motif
VTRSPLSRLLSAPLLLVVLVGATACGGAQPAAPSAPEAAATAMPMPEDHAGHGGHGGHGSGPAPALYAVQTGPLGVVLTDGSGHLIYRSDTDRADPPTSTCIDDCAQSWIPVTAPADQELELAGVKKELVGRLQRPDGSSQLTLAGWPLYRNRDDDGSLGSTGRNGAEGTWFVVTPKGDKAAPA